MEKFNNISSPESLQTEYSNLLTQYLNLNKKRKKILHDVERGFIDKLERATQFELEETDSQRHEVHLALQRVGSRLDKDESGVLVDIIRHQNSLEDYGVPELSILTADDVTAGDWHNPYSFNVDGDTLRPSPVRKRTIFKGEEPAFKKDEVMLVYCIVPYKLGDEPDPSPQLPPDLDDRLLKAATLAENVNGRFFDAVDSDYHEASARVIGVIMPKKELESVLGMVRDNPQKYRVGF